MSNTELDRIHQDNRQSWNAATRAHNSHKADQARFLREGGSTIFPEEIALLGDLEGRSLLHLLCNSGQDTLSLAARGARVTGVDLSDEAVAFARRLSEDSGIPGTFHQGEAQAWLDEAARDEKQRFDLAYCSYGALCWISDIRRFARGVAAVLAPGGRFVAVEFHPMIMVFDEKWQIRYPYFHDGALRWDEGISDYVGDSGATLAPSGYQAGVEAFDNPYPSHEFIWPLADIVSAFVDAGLTLETLKEYPYSNGWKGFEGMREDEHRRTYPPEGFPNLPLMYSLAARKG